jgi:hypothetical protein
MEGNGGQLPCLNLWCNEGREVASAPLRSFRDRTAILLDEPRVFQRSRWTSCLGSSARLSFISMSIPEAWMSSWIRRERARSPRERVG